MLAGEHLAGTAQAGLDLVEDEQSAVLPALRFDRLQVAVRGHDDSGGTLDWLEDDRSRRLLPQRVGDRVGIPVGNMGDVRE